MGSKGQTQIELAITAAVISLVVTGAGWVLKAEWERAKCAYLVFETTHARLANHPLPPVSVRVDLNENEQSVSGQARCGQANEVVRFTKLEHVQW